MALNFGIDNIVYKFPDPGIMVTGNLTDSNGNPLANQIIIVNGPLVGGNPSLRVTTDGDGDFTLDANVAVRPFDSNDYDLVRTIVLCAFSLNDSVVFRFNLAPIPPKIIGFGSPSFNTNRTRVLMMGTVQYGTSHGCKIRIRDMGSTAGIERPNAPVYITPNEDGIFYYISRYTINGYSLVHMSCVDKWGFNNHNNAQCQSNRGNERYHVEDRFDFKIFNI